jgi:hypothetical protein
MPAERPAPEREEDQRAAPGEPAPYDPEREFVEPAEPAMVP